MGLLSLVLLLLSLVLLSLLLLLLLPLLLLLFLLLSLLAQYSQVGISRVVHLRICAFRTDANSRSNVLFLLYLLSSRCVFFRSRVCHTERHTEVQDCLRLGNARR